jgi:hypothetical protein
MFVASKNFDVVAMARFSFGSDGSGQKSTTAYRPIKQLPQNWIRTVSWLNRGKVHIITNEEALDDPSLSFLVQMDGVIAGSIRTASVQVVDRRTLLVLLTVSGPKDYSMSVFDETPFAAPDPEPIDCGFDLQVLRATKIPTVSGALY